MTVLQILKCGHREVVPALWNPVSSGRPVRKQIVTRQCGVCRSRAVGQMLRVQMTTSLTPVPGRVLAGHIGHTQTRALGEELIKGQWTQVKAGTRFKIWGLHEPEAISTPPLHLSGGPPRTP